MHVYSATPRILNYFLNNPITYLTNAQMPIVIGLANTPSVKARMRFVILFTFVYVMIDGI